MLSLPFEMLGVIRKVRARVDKALARTEPAEDAGEHALDRCAQMALFRGDVRQLDDEGGDDDEAEAAPGQGARDGEAVTESGYNLVRYCVRPPLALGRLSMLPAGRIAYRIKKLRGGRAKVRVMTPVELLARLAALIPPPRHPLTRFHGVFAPRSSWRRDVVPKLPEVRPERRCRNPGDMPTQTADEPASPKPATRRGHSRSGSSARSSLRPVALRRALRESSSALIAAPGMHVTPSVRLVCRLGEGGMGAVWVADHLTLATQVVVKFIATDLVSDPAVRDRFAREAAAAAAVKSPHVVQMLDYGTSEDVPFIVMELLEGEDLRRRMERERTLPIKDVEAIIAQACKALGQAHTANIVHRDVKPDNIFLCTTADAEIFVKLLDFGIAKRPRVTGQSDPVDAGRARAASWRKADRHHQGQTGSVPGA